MNSFYHIDIEDDFFINYKGSKLTERFTKELESNLAESDGNLGPRLVNRWNGQEIFYRVEMPHNSWGVDPQIACNGNVSVILPGDGTGDKISYCQSCQSPVTVNVDTLLDGLKLRSKPASINGQY